MKNDPKKKRYMKTKSWKAASYVSIVMFQNYPCNAINNREFFSDAGQPWDNVSYSLALILPNFAPTLALFSLICRDIVEQQKQFEVSTLVKCWEVLENSTVVAVVVAVVGCSRG